MSEVDEELSAFFADMGEESAEAEAPEVEAKAEESEETADIEAQATGEEDDTPPVSDERVEHAKPPEGYVPLGALSDERAKRQAMQAELDALRKAAAPKAEPEARVDFLDDPDKWEQQLTQQVEAKVNEVRNESRRHFLGMVENAARSRYQDYDEAVNVFSQVAGNNEALLREAANAPDPAEFAYQAGQKLKLLADPEVDGDMMKLIQREREKAVAEYLAQHPVPASKAQNIPESLSKVTGVSQKTEQIPVETPLEKMFNTY